MGFLEARCRELGLAAVERELRRAACEHGAVVAAIHRALRAEAPVLRRDIGELPVRIYNRLRCSGWDAAQIESTLRFAAGLPVPRLRHPVAMPIAEVALERHEQGIWACATTRDDRVVSASRDQTLRVWDLSSGELLTVLRGHDYEVRDCAVMPDGRRVVSASADGTLRIWDIDTGRPITTLAGHTARVLACAVTPDGRRIVSASGDGTLRIWNPETGGVLAILKGHTSAVRDCAVTPDGRRIVSVSYDGLLKVWSLQTGELLATLRGPGYQLMSCTVSPDGVLVIAATGDGPLQSWHLETFQPIATFRGHTRGPKACLVTPDGRLLITGAMENPNLCEARDHTVRVWELATGKEIATIGVCRLGHGDVVLDLALAPDGRGIVSASWDGTLCLWSLEAALAHPVAHPPGGPS